MIASFRGYIYYWRLKFRFQLLWPWRRKFKVMDFNRTLDYALRTRCSLSRFGDGELGFALSAARECRTGSMFQSCDPKLCQRLLEILQTDSGSDDRNNLLVCIVGFPFNLGCRVLKHTSRVFWYAVGNNYTKKLLKHININRHFGEAAFTRFYISYREKQDAKSRFDRIKQLWDNDDLLIVEGEKSRLGVGNDIFDNARSIRRILCPATDAFSRYDEILAAVKKHAKPTDTVILALGQTATVLAYDLAHEGYRALDLGHIDIEYEWMRMGAEEKVPVPGKFTNEAAGGQDVADFSDERFNSQILDKVLG